MAMCKEAFEEDPGTGEIETTGGHLGEGSQNSVPAVSDIRERLGQELCDFQVPTGAPDPLTASPKEINNHLKKVIVKLATSVCRNSQQTKVRSMKSYFQTRYKHKNQYRIIHSLWIRNRRMVA